MGAVMDVLAAKAIIDQSSSYIGPFYGAAPDAALGAGLLYDKVRYPVFDPDRRIFVTRAGVVFVVSHECDVEQENDRPFNDDVLVCPVIQFPVFIAAFSERYGERKLRSYLSNLGAKRIYQLLYLPEAGESLPYGGVMFLAQMASTKVAEFQSLEARKIGALSAFGLETVDRVVKRMLFRPKADRLAFAPDPTD